MTHNQAMLQTQLQQMMKDTKSIFGYVAPPKLSNNNRKNESHSSKKKHTSSKPKKSQRPKPLVYKVLVPEPEGLNAAECAALRAIAHIFDPDLTCVIKDDKTVLIIQYLKDILSNYSTHELRASIPEHSNDQDDSDFEAEKDAIDLEDTDDEDEEETIDEKEFKDFIVDDDDDIDEGDEEGDEEGEGDEVEEEEETEEPSVLKRNKKKIMNESKEEEETEEPSVLKKNNKKIMNESEEEEQGISKEEEAEMKKTPEQEEISLNKKIFKKEEVQKTQKKPPKTKSLFEWMQQNANKKSKK